VLQDLIKRLSAEVEGQPKILEDFARQRLPKARQGSIFVGAGDSFAAAQLGFFGSNCRHIALDPYVLASNPEIAEGREVYFISISGRTRSNAQAARRAGPYAKQTTALTAVADSPLARVTDRLILLPMTYLPRMPGLLSFSLSALAAMRISGAEGRCDYGGALRKARNGEIGFAEGNGTTYFLGNSLAFPVSLYAAAKTYEILGTKAHAELLEEFNHLELFSMARSDAVNGFSCFDPSGLAAKLSSALADRRLLVVRGWGRSPTEKLFHAIFQVQLSVLGEARRRGVTTPRFLSRRDSLAASDRMIY
jgi:glutamine---fructose-6-phosphate transaminase (isomerizing)